MHIIKTLLTKLVDSIRDYEHESGNMICFDERESHEFAQLFIDNKGFWDHKELSDKLSWKYVNMGEPLTYITGNFDGKKSDPVIAQDKNGKYYIAEFYKDETKGEEFEMWCDQNDNIINESIIKYYQLPE